MNAGDSRPTEGRSSGQSLGRLLRRATTWLSPTVSTVLVVAVVIWMLARALIPLGGAVGSLVDTFNGLVVLLTAIGIEAARGSTDTDNGPGRPPSSAGH